MSAVRWAVTAPTILIAALSKRLAAFPLVVLVATRAILSEATNLGRRFFWECTVAQLTISDAAKGFARAASARGVAAVAPDAGARLETVVTATVTVCGKDLVASTCAFIAGPVGTVLSVHGNTEHD